MDLDKARKLEQEITKFLRRIAYMVHRYIETKDNLNEYIPEMDI